MCTKQTFCTKTLFGKMWVVFMFECVHCSYHLSFLFVLVTITLPANQGEAKDTMERRKTNYNID